MEILYRGFHVDKNGTTEIVVNGEKIRGDWVEGSPIKMDSFERCQMFIFPFYENASSLSCKQLVELRMVSVIPETVGQYTGKEDKNGKKIVVGDVCDIYFLGNGPYVAEVVYNPNLARFEFWTIITADCEEKVTLALPFTECDNIEVIGTIYDAMGVGMKRSTQEYICVCDDLEEIHERYSDGCPCGNTPKWEPLKAKEGDNEK